MAVDVSKGINPALIQLLEPIHYISTQVTKPGLIIHARHFLFTQSLDKIASNKKSLGAMIYTYKTITNTYDNTTDI